MSKLRQLFLGQSTSNLVLVLESFTPDRLDPGSAGFRKPRADRPAVFRVRHALDQPVALEMIDQARDVAWRGVQVCGEIAQRGRPAPVQAEKNPQAALAQVVSLSPAL